MLTIKSFSDKTARLIDAKPSFEKLATGCKWSEGPVYVPEIETVYYTDFPDHIIYKWNEREGAGIFREDSGRAIGLAIDRQGRMLCAESATRGITRMERDGRFSVIASVYDGKLLNSPNDVVVKSDGSVYFTDPFGGGGNQFELSHAGVYRLDPETGETVLLCRSERPNGLAFSTDEKTFYIDDTNLQNVQAFDVKPDGTLDNARVFAQLDTAAGNGGADGMKVDIDGNLYITGPGGIWVYSPEGEKLALMRTPEIAANLCFGGKDGRTMYITAQSSLYALGMNIPGVVSYEVQS